MKKIFLSLITVAAIIIGIGNLHAMVGSQARQFGRYIPTRPLVRPTVGLPIIRAPFYRTPMYRGFATRAQSEEAKKALAAIKNSITAYGLRRFEKLPIEDLQSMYDFLQEVEPDGWAIQEISRILEVKKQGLGSIPYQETATKGIVSRYGRGLAAAIGAGAAAAAAYCYLMQDIDEVINEHNDEFDILLEQLKNKPIAGQLLSGMDEAQQKQWLRRYLHEGALLSFKRSGKVPSWEDIKRNALGMLAKRYELWRTIAQLEKKITDQPRSPIEMAYKLEKEWAKSDSSIEDFVNNLTELYILDRISLINKEVKELYR